MTRDQAFTKIQSLQNAALTQVAYVAMAHVMPFVPIDTGRLRQSGKVESDSEGVNIVFGGAGSGVEKYASYQYATAERHLTDGGSLGRILEVIPPDIRKNVKGQTNRQRYAAAYRYAVDTDKLTRFPGGARWFRIILEDSGIQNKMAQVYRNYLKSSSNEAAA
jgi:hypothetical protein